MKASDMHMPEYHVHAALLAVATTWLGACCSGQEDLVQAHRDDGCRDTGP